MKYIKHAMVIFTLILMLISSAQATCNGRMTNPVTDVCWSCLFPISIGGWTVAEGAEFYDTPNPASPVCKCGSPIPRFGISVGFWEPVRMADVVREPFCFVNLGGISIDPGYPAPAGAQSYEDSTNRKAFYQVHWYEYPALILLDIITFVTCLEGTDFDIVHMSEFDVTWNNDLDSFIFFPETALFGNPVAQAACAADCVAASTGKLPMDALFWCAGCHGSMYPMTGNIGNQTSPLQGSVLLVERSTFNLHRIGAIQGSMGEAGMCGTYYMPIMDKSQYKTQLTYPFTGQNKGSELACNPYGRTTTLWESGKSFPEFGEDFGYLVWRKRNCCAF